MTKWFVIVILFLFLLPGCNPKSTFFNHEKWKVNMGYDLGYLKREPKAVMTILYDQLKDTNINSTGHVNTTESEYFDENGNLVSGYMSIDRASTIKYQYRYTDSGVFYHIYGYSDDNTTVESETWTESIPLDKNRYLKSKYSKDEGVVTKSYEDTILSTVDQMIQTRVYSNRFIQEKTWFKENRIIRKEKLTNTDSDTIFYYRSKHNFLDSIVSTDQDKEIFINNQYGDPLFYFRLNGSDTIDIERSQYQYDAKGNWIRKFSYLKSRSLEPQLTVRFSNYSLMVRTIKY